MTRGVFVTGTDTGVGKTLACCALLHALAARGVAAAPMKPIAAGADATPAGWVNGDTVALLDAAGWPASRAAEVTPVLLRAPMAPHLAAAREGRRIDVAAVMRAFERLGASQAYLVVEGVGGFRVPLDETSDTADLAKAMALPVVMVVGVRLGCLNHAILTAQSIAAAGLGLAGWIASMVDPEMVEAEENVDSLARRIAAPLLGRLPFQREPQPRALAAELDVGPLLGGA